MRLPDGCRPYTTASPRIGRKNDHREDASHFTNLYQIISLEWPLDYLDPDFLQIKLILLPVVVLELDLVLLRIVFNMYN